MIGGTLGFRQSWPGSLWTSRRSSIPPPPRNVHPPPCKENHFTQKRKGEHMEAPHAWVTILHQFRGGGCLSCTGWEAMEIECGCGILRHLGYCDILDLRLERGGERDFWGPSPARTRGPFLSLSLNPCALCPLQTFEQATGHHRLSTPTVPEH